MGRGTDIRSSPHPHRRHLWRLNSTPRKNWHIQHCAPKTNSWLRLWIWPTSVVFLQSRFHCIHLGGSVGGVHQGFGAKPPQFRVTDSRMSKYVPVVPKILEAKVVTGRRRVLAWWGVTEEMMGKRKGRVREGMWGNVSAPVFLDAASWFGIVCGSCHLFSICNSGLHCIG